MIRLDIKEYCDWCCDFEPDVTAPEKLYKVKFNMGEEIVMGDTIIRCTHAKRCESIKRYLMRQDATYRTKE